MRLLCTLTELIELIIQLDTYQQTLFPVVVIVTMQNMICQLKSFLFG